MKGIGSLLPIVITGCTLVSMTVFANVIKEPEDENVLHEVDSVSGDTIIYGGDMILTTKQSEALLSGQDEQETTTVGNEIDSRKVTSDTRKLWPNGIIPFKINEGERKFSHPRARYYIETAIKHWERLTCLQFMDITTDISLQQSLATQLGHSGYLDIGTGKGCASMVGNQKMGQPVLLFEPYCLQPGTIIHEIGHAIGYFHEQERQDRNKYIEIFKENIIPGKEINFRMSVTSFYGVPYDLSSTMSYGPYFFSKDDEPTIQPLDRNLVFLMGRREGLSFYDAMAANAAYKCAESCPDKSKCQNGGFLSKTCNCICPHGLQGDRCEEVDTKGCGHMKSLSVGEQLIITSPDYPKAYRHTLCTWFIKAPVGKRIRTIIQVEDMPDEMFEGEQFCFHSVEVRYNLVGQEGPRYCGKGEVHFLPLSTSNTVTLLFDSTDDEFTGIGFKAEFYVEEDTSTTTHTIFECTFDDTACGFNSPDSSPYDWEACSWKPFGPFKDHTNSKGFYLAESSFFKWEPTTSTVQGAVIYPLGSGEHCIEFWYYARGIKMGNLKLYIVSSDDKKLLWSVNDKTYNGKWKLINIPVYIKQHFQIMFELATEKFYDNFAVDDMKITEGSC